MRCLLIHNSYQHAGGEDVVFRAESALLRRAGHEVIEYTRTNADLVLTGAWSRLRTAANTIWARDEARVVRELVERTAPDVAHFHNTMPLISPAAYYACRGAGVPVVQTLHNYRLLCPSASHYRANRVCEDCTQSGLLQSVRHGCYRDSRAATATVAAMLGVHRALGTWHNQIDVYIACSEFARQKFVDGGLPAHKIIVKPNFIDLDPGAREGSGHGALFVGRLWPEKGVRTMLEAWRKLREPLPLAILADGPERAEMEALVATRPEVRFLGRRPHAETLASMRQAQFLVFPSEWYEGMPMTILEAFASGVPVIASRIGTMAEVIEDGRTGLHFASGDAADLASKLEWAQSHPDDMERMGRAARAEYLAKYTGARNIDLLIAAYDQARAISSKSAAFASPPPAAAAEHLAHE